MSPRQPLWQDIVVDDRIVISSPVALVRTGAVGMDTAFSEWHGEGLVVRIDQGLFVDTLQGNRNRPAVDVVDEHIDGLPATIVGLDRPDGERFTAVHFGDLSSLGRGRNRLTLVVLSRAPRTADEARLMARSVRFLR